MNSIRAKYEWERSYDYLPYKFHARTEQTWAKVKANALALAKRKFRGAKVRIYKNCTCMEIIKHERGNPTL